jgi:hypothetical protein
MGGGDVRPHRHRGHDRRPARALLRERGAGRDRHADDLEHEQRAGEQHHVDLGQDNFAYAFAEPLTYPLSA